MKKMILTQAGMDKLNIIAGTDNPSVEWKTMVFGDGNGTEPTFTQETKELVNEVYRTDVLSVTRDANNNPWHWFESSIPPDVGNFWVREMGLIDSDGDLVAVGAFPSSYKPIMGENNVAKTILVKSSVQLSIEDNVTFVIDPNVVMASRAWVLENFIQKEETHKFDTSIYGEDIDFMLPDDKEDGYVVNVVYQDVDKTASVKVSPSEGESIVGVEAGDTADIDVISITKFIFEAEKKTWHIIKGGS